MRHSVILIGASIWAFAVSPALSDFVDGNRLRDACVDTVDQSARGLCLGFIAAASDMSKCDRAYKGFSHNAPEGASLLQVKTVVVKWLNEHPELWHYAATELVAAGLQETWPCT